jgi:5-methylcytosine-specific restriction endonuclease McrA
MSLTRRARLKAGKPLAPMSDRRRAQLLETGLLARGSTFALPRRPALAKKRPADTGPDRNTVDAVLDRDAHCCCRCGGGLHGTRGVDYSLHHRKRRSQGGDNSPANLVSLCGHGTAGCHGWTHAEPELARDVGLLVRRNDNPLATPVAHGLHGHVFLTVHGSVSSCPTLSED